MYQFASTVIAVDDQVSWDDTAKKVNLPGTGSYLVGTAIEAAGNGIATVHLRLAGVATAAA